MKLNVTIADGLLEEAMAITGINEPQDVIEHSLRTLVRVNRQAELNRFRGALPWVGDLDAMRRDKT